ncbi:MAG: type II toxin-antitoxin system PemK/MazF family toxin [Acidobacteriota bacterium]
MSGVLPSRGEIWLVDLDPVRGREQAGKRPALVVSTDVFNHGPAELVLLLPITTKDKCIPLHIAVSAAGSGLRERSFVKCEDLRSVSRDRLTTHLGAVGPDTLADVEDRLRILLEL